MRILIVNTDYPRFLARLYGECPGLDRAAYGAQLAARNDSLFGVADYYSRNFIAHGHQSWEVHVNNPWLQAAWAKEHGVACGEPPGVGELDQVPARKPGRFAGRAKTVLRPLVRPFRSRRGAGVRLTDEALRIFLAQVDHYRPDVILNQDMGFIGSEILGPLARRGILIVGQIASPLPVGERFGCYALVISSLPNFVLWFRRRGVRAELNRLGFEPSILDRLGPPPPRDISVSFVGSLSPEHADRIALLEMIAKRVDLRLWGQDIERLPQASPLWACYQGEAWGRGMYDVLRRSRITVNSHIDLSEGYANNMRLYEATGAGAALVTDAKRNLDEIFTSGVEVVSYSSREDCVTRIEQLLGDERGRAAVAAAGQARTLRDHNYYNRTGEILALVGKVRHERAA